MLYVRIIVGIALLLLAAFGPWIGVRPAAHRRTGSDALGQANAPAGRTGGHDQRVATVVEKSDPPSAAKACETASNGVSTSDLDVGDVTGDLRVQGFVISDGAELAGRLSVYTDTVAVD